MSQVKSWPWKKAIALVDMNAFFCSVEQLDHPELRNRPVGVLPNHSGTILIASSYEAKARNINTGCHRYEAIRLCPQIQLVTARPQRYTEISTLIMHQLYCHVTHQMEVFSIDEAFLDVTRLQDFFSSPEALAIHIQKVVLRASGLPVSVGLSGDRTTAKWACKRFRPLGIGIVDPSDAGPLLAHIPVEELCGINRGVKRYLSHYRVTTCADLAKLPLSILTQRFGKTGCRLRLMAQGLDPQDIQKTAFPKSIGNSKMIPSHQRRSPHIQRWCLKLAHQLTDRLTRKNVGCHTLIVAFSYENGQRWKYQTVVTEVDPIQWYQIILQAQRLSPHNDGIKWMGLYAKSLYSGKIQDLWKPSSITPLSKTLGAIRDKWGSTAIMPLSYLNWAEHQWTPGIAPSWRPQSSHPPIPGLSAVPEIAQVSKIKK